MQSIEVHFTRAAEKKLNDLAAQSGRGADKDLQDALAGYFEEVTQTRDMLNSRYDDLKSGTAKPIDGEEAFARLRAKTEAQRNRPAWAVMRFTRKPMTTSTTSRSHRAGQPYAADGMITEIFDAICALVPFPNQGYRPADLTSRPLRFIVVREYLIAYAPEQKPLWVVAVMHGRRSPRITAVILRGREQATDTAWAS